jgi:hypothetical protein
MEKTTRTEMTIQTAEARLCHFLKLIALFYQIGPGFTTKDLLLRFAPAPPFG